MSSLNRGLGFTQYRPNAAVRACGQPFPAVDVAEWSEGGDYFRKLKATGRAADQPSPCAYHQTAYLL
jgi:hypothetical protein